MARRRRKPTPVVMRKKESSVITITVDPLKVAKGHAAHRSGAGTHADKRLKRRRTRAAANRLAIVENQ